MITAASPADACLMMSRLPPPPYADAADALCQLIAAAIAAIDIAIA